MLIRTLLFVSAVVALTACQSVSAEKSVADERVDAVLSHFKANPIEELPVTNHPVLTDETFSRLFNISLSARAYLQLMTDASKDQSSGAMLEKVAQYYLDHPEEIPDPDSTYWAGEYHAAAVAKFGINGTVRPGAIPRDAERKLLEYMVSYVNQWSRLEHYQLSLKHQTYYYWNSENHWWQEIVTAWGYLLVLKDDPEFMDTVLADGRSLLEHYDANLAYMKEHMRQRAKKGFFVEISSGGYAGRMHNMYFMIYEISPDEDLKALATKTLDLWWAFWAEEQILGERGGGKVRHRRLRGLTPNAENHMIPAWYYFGIGPRDLDYIQGLRNSSTAAAANYLAVLSDYRPAPFVEMILEDRSSAPAYSITQRRIGRSAGQDNTAPSALLNEKRDKFDREGIERHKFYDIEQSDVLKYSWVSPNFVLGTNMRPPHDVKEWVAGSAQGWWHGLLLSGTGKNYPERVVPTLLYPRDSMGEQYAVQHRGSLMARKLNDVWSKSRNNTELPMGVFISKGLEAYTELDGEMIFIESPKVWAAVRAVGTEFTPANDLLTSAQRRAGSFFKLQVDNRPVIIEAAERGEYESFDAFKEAVLSAQVTVEDGAYRYESLSGKNLIMFDDRTNPMIGDQVIDYTPSFAYRSRYISSDWDSGVVTINVGDRQHQLDFSVH
ncbi:MAG: hypothetical protein ACON4C_02235 [Henriciella sp.]